MSTRRPHRAAAVGVAAALAIAAPLTLSGCSLIHLPGSSTGGGISIPGVGSVGSGKLPKDFPSEVPVAQGEVISGISAGSGADEGWNATIKVDGLDAFDGIESQFKDAGFAEKVSAVVKSATTATAAFTSDHYDVLVAVVKADDKTGFVANYTVARHKAGSGGG